MNSSTLPLVSVVIPAYNAERYLRRTLESALAQTYSPFEVIVVDDGSTDQTPQIVRSFCEQDRRVVLLQKENGGVATARNLGIQHSHGELIAPLDSDDVWYPEKLAEQVKLMQQCDESVGLVYCWSRIIDDADRPIVDITHRYEGDVVNELMFSNFLGNGSCALIRRSCFDVVGWYNGATTPCEEWDMYLRIAERYHVRLVPKILVGYREVLTSLSANYRRMERAFAAFTDELRKRHPELPHSIMRYARSSFYLYLTGKSNRQQQYGITLQYLWKCLAADPARILSSEFHLTLVKALIRFITSPITSRVWKDDRAWRNVRRQLRRLMGRADEHVTAPGTTDVAGTESDSPRRLYDRIHHQRMMQFKHRHRESHG
jgi:glycosyltransferase involved in cell wall biosynthesis